MHVYIRRLQTTVLITASLFCAHLQAQEPAENPAPCSLSDDTKEVLCGHALAQIQSIDAGLSPLSNTNGMESQDDTDITHVFLDFELFFTTKSLGGSVTFDVTSRTDGLTQMTLDFESGMVVDSVSVNGAAVTYTRPPDQVLIELGATYNRGDTFTLQVAFHGSPKDRVDWYGFSWFDTQGSTTKPIAASFCQPFYARHWWPCKDNIVSNTDKFTLDTHVTVPDNMTAVCNGSLQGADVLPDARKEFRWHESYPIVTYLVSFAATQYVKQTQYYNHAGGSMPVEFYAYYAQDPYYLTTLVQTVATFSDPGVYGPYPFLTEKYAIAQFQWIGAMENQTVTSSNKFTSVDLNAHELAHQWWGDNVTCKTWHDIWLHEGFAHFSEAIFKEKQPGGTYSAYLTHLLKYRPSTSGTGTVYRYDISTSDAIFNPEYTYNKAAWVLHMLRCVMGDPAFFSALTSFQAAFQGSTADTEDFRAFCEAAHGSDLSWFFNEWVYNTGIPYYRYGWTEEQIDGQHWLLLSIEQYQGSLVAGYPASMRMPVEIGCTTASGTQIHQIWTGTTTWPGKTLIEWFRLPVDGPVSRIRFDPNGNILCVTQSGNYIWAGGEGADLDRDNDVDRTDLALFETCITGPEQGGVIPACASVDFDSDHDIDQSDFGHFQRCLGESGDMPPNGCLGV